ncbi:MAG: hypothetical protein FWG21_03760 [Oscillospiraceae bacterium]|nr:hypothetical protein [Oscillospiraceae bacterium]
MGRAKNNANFYCLFDKNYTYGSDTYSRLLGEKAFHELERRLISREYKLFTNYGLTAGFPVVSITYANMTGSKNNPKDDYLSKIKHSVLTSWYYLQYTP